MKKYLPIIIITVAALCVAGYLIQKNSADEMTTADSVSETTAAPVVAAPNEPIINPGAANEPAAAKGPEDVMAPADRITEDAVRQYQVAKSAGDKVDIATRATIVADAYKQAKDDANYQKWKEIARQARKDAGMPE